jgi:lactoylglutathione lyase
MSHLNHVALWVKDLDGLAAFYVAFFDATAADVYYNPAKGFSSRFLAFDTGPGVELMHQTRPSGPGQGSLDGYAHVALSLGSREAVDDLSKVVGLQGHRVIGGPRKTGDGFYESTILDPEGNVIELTI